MSLVFYYAPQSTASATHWVLEELGIPYEKVRVDITKKEQKEPKFLAKNPNGKVPVIEHDGTPIFESAAIAVYLGETFGVEKKLFPAPGAERAKAIQWLVWCNVSLGGALGQHNANNSDRVPAELRNEKAGAVARADVEQHLAVLNGALEGRSYLVGDTFTLADAHIASWVSYVGMCGFDLKGYRALTAWSDRCHARPAASRAE